MDKAKKRNMYGKDTTMRWLSKRKNIREDRVEQRFQLIVDLIKDLDKREFTKLKEGIDLAWQAYDKISKAKTNIEKEIDDIDSTEIFLEEASGRNQ